MMQGFYRETQGRNESIAHYVTRLEGKLKDIHVKHLHCVSVKETAGYSRDHLFYVIRKHFWETMHAKFDNPMNDYMVLMHATWKAEGKHEQEKHNSSFHQYNSKSGVGNDVPMGNDGNANSSPEAPQEPCGKWMEMQQQFDSLMTTAKGAQNSLQNQQQQGPNQDQRNNNQNNNNNANNNGQRSHKHNVN